MTRILIADSGSTKTEWQILEDGQAVGSHFSEGINPFYEDAESIVSKLQNLFKGELYGADKIYFYGAGCANAQKKALVKKALSTLSPESSITVENDLLAAARALCGHQEGIACILGTGSNSCMYTGTEISENVSPLGYILGDEGSGAVLGKLLLADLLKNQLSGELTRAFFRSFELSPADIIDRVYRQAYPNRFLAKFSKFVKENIHHQEMENLVIRNFGSFADRNILQYDQAKQLPINFVGSIAFHFESQLRRVLESKGLELGTVMQTPMAGLIEYHKSALHSF